MICVYRGDMLDRRSAKVREEAYGHGNYMFHFEDKQGKKLW